MGFKVTVKSDDGQVIDEFEADCLAGAVHIAGSEDYQGLFYAECDVLTALRTLRTDMQVIADHISDEEIAEAAQDDETAIEEDAPEVTR